MTQLAASGLETADYTLPNWVAIYNANVQKLNFSLLKIQGLLDVDTSDLRDDSVLFWFAIPAKWKTRLVKSYS
jgi:hypothetical protein